MAYLQVTVEGNLAHDTLHECRLALAVTTHEGHLLTAADGQVDVLEHLVGTIDLADILADDGEVARAQTRRKLQAQGRRVHLVNLDGYHLFQLFHLLLHLHGFGGLIAETFDELPHVGHLLLLVLVGPELLLTTLLAQLDVFVVLDLIIYNVSAGNLQGAVGDVVDEGTVVADQHDGGRRLARQQFFLQPANGLDVQVVGRLVEQQHVGALQQNLGQLDAHAPASAELAGGTL